MQRPFVVTLAFASLASMAASVAAVDASAQALIQVGGGGTLPTSGYRDVANVGWFAHGGLALPLGGSGVSLGAAGFFGVNDHEPPPDGDRSRIYGSLGVLNVAFGDLDSVAFYMFGMGGWMVRSFKSDSQPGLDASLDGIAGGGGAGLSFPSGEIFGFVEAWYLAGFQDISRTQIGGVTGGVRIPVYSWGM